MAPPGHRTVAQASALLLALAALAATRRDLEMRAVHRAAKGASPQRVDRPELEVPPGTPKPHLRTRGEWVKRSFGEHSDAHHPQRYAADAAHGGLRRRLQRTQEGAALLTLENTAPLKIEVDFSGMYGEATDGVPSRAQPYSSCFEKGAWFKWNYPSTAAPPCESTCAACLAGGGGDCSADCSFPGSTAPCGGDAEVDARMFDTDNPDGILCNRQFDPSSQDCWGVCLEEDVLTAEMRTYMQAKILEVVAEVEGLFRVRKRTGNMVLANSEGVYSRLYATMGVDTAAECAKDARVMYRMPVADSYCTDGVDADVVFMPFMSPHVPNVAGFGGDAGKDQYGRPVMITMGWGMGEWGSDRANIEATARAVIMHELVHGLGFNIFQFQNSFDSAGRSKTIVLLTQMVDTDGSVDQVWHAVGERVVSVGRAYFGCTEAEWSGMTIPLMGENPLGDTSRGSHWETRIMKDEFLAYGGGSMVSAFTLAMMEDLGHYIGNYSKVAQMSWGRGQGCAFIAHRCGTRTDDCLTSGILPDDIAECRAPHPYYAQTGLLAQQLNSKCASPPNCGRDWSSPCLLFCNAECVSDPLATLPADHSTLAVPPIGDGIEAAGSKDAGAARQSSTSLAFVGSMGSLVGLFLLGLFVLWFLDIEYYHCMLRLSIGISAAFLVFGLVFIGFGVYLLNEFEHFEAFLSRGLVVGGIFVGVAIFAFAVLGLWGACRNNKKGTKFVLSVFFTILLFMIVIELIIVFSLVMWVDEISQASADTGAQFDTSIVAQTQSTGAAEDDASDGDLLSGVVGEVEGYACRTYKSCCWVPAPNQTTCTQAHSGSSVGSAAAAQQDPSAPGFCQQVTGSSAEATDDSFLCDTLAQSVVDGQPLVNLTSCRAEFCDAGVEGFQDFIEALLNWVRSVRRNALPRLGYPTAIILWFVCRRRCRWPRRSACFCCCR